MGWPPCLGARHVMDGGIPFVPNGIQTSPRNWEDDRVRTANCVCARIGCEKAICEKSRHPPRPDLQYKSQTRLTSGTLRVINVFKKRKLNEVWRRMHTDEPRGVRYCCFCLKEFGLMRRSAEDQFHHSLFFESFLFSLLSASLPLAEKTSPTHFSIPLHKEARPSVSYDTHKKKWEKKMKADTWKKMSSRNVQ